MVTSDVLITNRTSLKNMPYFDFHAFIHHLSHNQETISLLIPATCIINEIISSLITAFELIKDFINMQKWSTWSQKKMSISYSLFQNQYNKWSIQQLFFIPFFFYFYSWLFFCCFLKKKTFYLYFSTGWLASYPQTNT
jgi:hypothetical protein